MKTILVLATAGAGGDLQPLLTAALALRERQHRLVLLGDASVSAAVTGLGFEMVTAPPDHDLGPRLVATIKAGLGQDPAEQGQRIEALLERWSSELATIVQALIRQHPPDLLVTSLFGVGIAQLAAADAQLPWCVVNSTFYVGPHPPRVLESDFSARAVPLMRYFISKLGSAEQVLHATDRVFDYNFTNLPARHHYVGPLIWEAPSSLPAYWSELAGPWALVTLSLQEQDDLPLAQAALDVLASQPLQVALTIGNSHQPDELKRVPTNAHVEQYLPHSAVLERGRLLVSHAGHGSVMKALWHGVPMVLVPWGRDQPGVAARAEHLGAAVVVERNQLSPETLSAAIQAVLADRQFQAAAQQTAQRLRAQNPAAIACDWLEQV